MQYFSDKFCSQQNSIPHCSNRWLLEIGFCFHCSEHRYVMVVLKERVAYRPLDIRIGFDR
jgi:hypothetical protein